LNLARLVAIILTSKVWLLGEVFGNNGANGLECTTHVVRALFLCAICFVLPFFLTLSRFLEF